MIVFKEPVFVVLGIVVIAVLIAFCVTMYQARKEDKMLKNVQGSYAPDGIWDS